MADKMQDALDIIREKWGGDIVELMHKVNPKTNRSFAELDWREDENTAAELAENMMETWQQDGNTLSGPDHDDSCACCGPEEDRAVHRAYLEAVAQS